MSPRVLIVEDDDLIGTGLRRAFQAGGLITDRVGDAAAALAAVRAGGVDLVLLDLGLPDGDGVDVARAILTIDPQLPILVLTARSEEADVVAGLHAGAVDYVTKPFRLAELLARVQTHLRTARRRIDNRRVVAVGDVRVDLAARRAWIGESEVELRPKEFDLLARLVRDAGQAVTREQLMADVWDEHWFGSTNTLDVHMTSLRRRLGEGPGQPSRITALRGVGYRFEIPG